LTTEFSVDTGMLRKHGRNMEETLTALRSSPYSDALSARLTTSDFGNTEEASDAARSYTNALTNLADMVNGLHEAGIEHARALCRSATLYEDVETGNVATARSLLRD
jgi:hypothetical protein